MGSSHKTFDWREQVERVDGKNRHTESLYPVVYFFSGGAVKKRDTGPESGVYEK